jgi:hypothetical protein
VVGRYPAEPFAALPGSVQRIVGALADLRRLMLGDRGHDAA